MKRHLAGSAVLAALCMVGSAHATINTLMMTENFDVRLGPSVNERLGFPIDTVVAGTPNFLPVPNVYSATGPAGWVVDNNFDNFGNTSLLNTPPVAGTDPPVGEIIGNVGVLNQGDPNHGVKEWEGWSFVDKDFWVEAAGDQDRSLYTGGVGKVAVADPDEYDDLGDGRGGGYYNTGLTTDFINVSHITPSPFSFAELKFDSSWRDESFDDSHDANPALGGGSYNNQTAVIVTEWFDSGFNPLGLDRTLTFDSDSGGEDAVASLTFKDDTPQEVLTTSIPISPAGTEYVKLTFGMVNAGNDWWWAIDNLELSEEGVPASTFWNEGFESVPLGNSVNEQRSTVPVHITAEQGAPNTSPRPDSFTNTPPADWNVDNSEIPTPPLGDNDDGSFELEGWNFMDLDFWSFIDQQDRELFTKSDGPFAVADGDEWDDLNDPTDLSIMKTVLESPLLNLPALDDDNNSLIVEFDSSWRDEDDNLAVITVDFGNGPVEMLRWESDDQSPFFHDDNPNESVSVGILIPAGATTAQLAFRYEGGNDWWWAVDNIRVGTGIPEPTSLVLSLMSVLGLGLVRLRRK